MSATTPDDSTAHHTPRPPGELTPLQRGLGLAVCLVTIVLAVLDIQIVSAATVPIVRDLDPAHGIDRIPWLVSAFALASAAVLPLYGKLCDVLGPKRVFLGAVTTFLTGSALCGAAQTIGELVAARALQGVGAGGLMSVTMVVLAHLKAPGDDNGGRGGSLGGVVAGGGMALGPWLGGVLSDHASWRWIFYVNLPLGLAVLVVGSLVLKLPGRTAHRSIDFPGAALAACFSAALILVTEWGGKQYAWSSPVIVGLALGSALSLGLFLWRQTTAAEPVLPLSMFRVPTLRWSFAIQGLMGAAMTGAIYYVLLYLQVVRAVPSSSAGLYLIPMAAGMTAVGLLSGRLAQHGWSERTFAICGAVVSTAAFLLLATTGTATSLWTVRGALLLLGIGFGQLIGLLIQLVQNTAPPAQLGVATTSIRFFQTLGQAMGAALLGTLLTRLYAAHGPGGDTTALTTLTGTAHAAGLRAYVSATDKVFLCGAALMGLALVCALLLPRRTPADRPAEGPAPEGDREPVPA
ncbi:MFS transporter [Streptomyces sp. NPDC008150]|uniref:MFS transporter n=1 Tax=Streptomyces sp. NPDC008150 TaxID=3364816 RepID=UPI0036F0EFFA